MLVQVKVLIPKPTVEAKKLGHHYPYALKVKYRKSSTIHPDSLFQLSEVHYTIS